MTHALRFGLLLLCSLLLTLTAQAAEPPKAQGHVVVDSVQQSYKIGNGETFTAEYDTVIRALTPQGASSLGKRIFQHSTKLQELTILEAETIKAGGRHLKVKNDAIETQDGILGNVSLKDYKVTSITFPDLSAGDSIHLRYRIEQKEAPLPGVLSIAEYFTDGLIISNARLDIEYPQGRDIRIDEHGLTLVRDEKSGGSRHLAWTYANTKIRTAEEAEANPSLNSPHLFISNAHSWDQLGQSYAGQHRGKARPTPAIEALARQLTEGAKDDREKTQRLYDWVRKNIRYVATYIGNGGWVPHEAAWVLENRYGDCKDHVVILEALLHAVGIESSPVLISAGSSDYSLPAVPILFFDHEISWVPSLDLFLDATADTVPFGLLPANEQDKPVLVIYREHNPYRSPMDGPENAEIIRTTRITVFANGSADRQTEVQAMGIASVWARDWYQGLGKGKENEWAKAQLKSQRLTGTADLALINDDEHRSVTYRNTQHIDNFLNEEEIGVMGLSPTVAVPISLTSFLGRFYDHERTRPGVCRPIRVTDRFSVHFEPGISLLRLPRNRHIQAGDVRFDASFSQSGNTITAQRSFEWSSPHYLCSSEDFQKLAPTMKKVMTALKAGLPYQRSVQE
jgi:transglutaminase-like putative cysteine protease